MMVTVRYHGISARPATGEWSAQPFQECNRTVFKHPLGKDGQERIGMVEVGDFPDMSATVRECA